jgi:hypothetical protein
MRRAQDLENRFQTLFACSEEKHHVTLALLAGELTLAEAAGEFERLQDVSGNPLEPLRRKFSGSSDEEVFCRYVIAWVDAELSTRPAERAAVHDRLEKELREHLGASDASGRSERTAPET